MFRSKMLDVVFSPRSKMLFYPSCGSVNIRPEIFDLDYYLFVFSDQVVEDNSEMSIANMDGYYRETYSFHELYQHFRLPSEVSKKPFYKYFIEQLYHPRKEDDAAELTSFRSLHRTKDFVLFRFNRKLGLLFYWDNNLTLAYLREKQAEIHALIGVNDGCRAVGKDTFQKIDNYECVNDDNWLKRVAAMAPKQGFLHITDHFPANINSIHDRSDLRVERIAYHDWAKANDLQNNPFPALMCSDENIYIHRAKDEYRPAR